MKTKLITALRLAASAIESKTFAYKWNNQETCNCGALICALTGDTQQTLNHKIRQIPNRKYKQWTELVGTYCPITGATMHEFFEALTKYGLMPQDIVHLENLSDDKIARRAGLKRWYRNPNKKQPKDVAAYMRAWADILAEEGQMDIAASYQKADEHTNKTVTREPSKITY